MNTTPWLKEKQVSEMTGLSLSTLQKLRLRHVGIPYIKIGKAVRYALEDIKAFMARNRIEVDTNYDYSTKI